MSHHIEQILHAQQSCIDVDVSSQKKLLETIANLAATRLNGCGELEIYESLIDRERLGSTCIGEGVAIPHCRLANCKQAVGVFLRLKQGLKLDSPDSQPVDLVFALIVPEDENQEHLNILASLAKSFNEPSYREALRKADSSVNFHSQAIAIID